MIRDATMLLALGTVIPHPAAVAIAAAIVATAAATVAIALAATAFCKMKNNINKKIYNNI